MAGVPTPPPATQTSSHDVVSATKTRPTTFPPGPAPAAALLAVAVGLLAVLLPSLVWEVPQLLVLGLVVSYGVFTTQQGNADGGSGNAGTKDGGALAAAWNARYRPDEPLVVVADRKEGAMERPLSLPVRRLKPPPTQVSNDTGDDASGDDCVGEETDESSASASSAGFRATGSAPSPPSVLDADLGLSPCSPQPQSPALCFAHGGGESTGCFSSGYYHPCLPGDETFSEDDGEVTDDWDEEEEEADDGSDEMTASSERSSSARGEYPARGDEHSEDDGDTSVDEELLKLASKAAPEGEDEVDRKADEFIAKFREQIRLQRH